jgi:hypothetical protein
VIRRILFSVLGMAVMASAAGTAVVAAGFALYALLAPQLGAPGAAASVAAAAAVLAAIAGLALGGKARPAAKPEPTLSDRIIDFARDRPAVAAGAALVAGLVALKNPKLAAGLASAFMAGKAVDKSESPRRRW